MEIIFRDDDGSTVSIIFRQVRTEKRWARYGLSFLITVLILWFVVVSLLPWAAKIFLLAIGFYPLYVAIRNNYRRDELLMQPEGMQITRRLLIFSIQSKFSQDDVETLSFARELSGYRWSEDSGLSLMVRSKVTPLLFARTITAVEATSVFDEVARRRSWLAAHIRPIGDGLQD